MEVICQLARMCYKPCSHKFKHLLRVKCVCHNPNVISYQKPKIVDQWGVEYQMLTVYRAYCIDYELWQDGMRPGVDFIHDGRIIHGYSKHTSARIHLFEDRDEEWEEWMDEMQERDEEGYVDMSDAHWEDIERRLDAHRRMEEQQQVRRGHDHVYISTGRIGNCEPNVQRVRRSPDLPSFWEDEHDR